MQQRGIKEQVMEYLYLKKKDKAAPSNTNIKLMHGMNRISIIVFLIALVIMVVRAITK
jgi:hypothetical protein